MLDFTLTPEQSALRQKARDFALKHVLPIAAYYDEMDETPISVIKMAFEAGLTTAQIPEQYGGMGYGATEGVIIVEEIAAACPGIATSIFDNALGMEPLILSENAAAKEKYLPQFANQFNLIGFATSEPMMGSDVSGIRCTATRDGDDYVLNGTKYWVTNGGIADYFSIFATVDPKSQHKGICTFLVEKKWDGVSIGASIPKLGQRCSNTAGIHFQDVRVPGENVLAQPGDGFGLAMKTFSRTRPAIGAFAVGAARSAMEYAISYAKKRRAFGTHISDFQAIQFKLAEMYQKIETSRLLVWKASWEADNGMDPAISASIAKMYATEAALDVVNESLQIFGGYGYTKMYPIEKLYRDIRLYKIYEGTSEIQRMIIAGHVLNGYQSVMPELEDIFVHREKDPQAVTDSDGSAAWRCPICGFVHYGDEAPDACPYCFFPKASFKKTT